MVSMEDVTGDVTMQKQHETLFRSKWKPVNNDDCNTFICTSQDNQFPSQICNIRIANAKDTEHIYQVHTDSIRELCSRCYNQDEITRWTARQNPEKYEEFIEKGAIFVAILNDKIVAFGHSEKFTDDTAQVCGLFVSPAYCRKGIGTLVLQFLEAKAKANGYKNMRLKSSKNAQIFYEANGYQAAEKVQCHCAGDQTLMCILMTKSLSND